MSLFQRSVGGSALYLFYAMFSICFVKNLVRKQIIVQIGVYFKEWYGISRTGLKNISDLVFKECVEECNCKRKIGMQETFKGLKNIQLIPGVQNCS